MRQFESDRRDLTRPENQRRDKRKAVETRMIWGKYKERMYRIRGRHLLHNQLSTEIKQKSSSSSSSSPVVPLSVSPFRSFSLSSLTAFPDSQMFLAWPTWRSQDKSRECLQDQIIRGIHTRSPLLSFRSVAQVLAEGLYFLKRVAVCCRGPEAV